MFTPTADTFAQEANPSQNYGSDTQLWVTFGTGSSQQSFLKFTVSGAAGTVHSATLRVYSTSATLDGPTLYGTAANWTETGLRWTNRPSVTSIGYDNQGAIAAGVWVEYNVTALVSGNGTYSFVLVNTSADAVSFSSREGVNPPQLVIRFGS